MLAEDVVESCGHVVIRNAATYSGAMALGAPTTSACRSGSAAFVFFVSHSTPVLSAIPFGSRFFLVQEATDVIRSKDQ
jgi:hypothetical protein